MTLQEATIKVQNMADIHTGKFGNRVNFEFAEGVIHLDDLVSPPLVSNEVVEVTCTIKISLENFEKLINQSLNPMMAFMSGKMKVVGDKSVAMKLAGLF